MSGPLPVPDMTRRAPDAEPGIDLAAAGVAHPAPCLLDLRVRAEELGEVVEHVSNVVYLGWLDRAAELHADALGYTRAWMLEHDRMWFVARHEIDYHEEVWRDDALLVATWVRDMKRVKSWRDTVIARARDGAVVCRAATLWVYVDLASRRPTRVPADMAERFQPLDRIDRSCTSPSS